MNQTNNIERLERIEVRGLFWKLDYDIDFRNGYDVSILIAPNGFGKTTILTIVDFILFPKIGGLRTVLSTPYDSITCFMSSGMTASLKRIIHEEDDYMSEEDPSEEIWYTILDEGTVSSMDLYEVVERHLQEDENNEKYFEWKNPMYDQRKLMKDMIENHLFMSTFIEADRLHKHAVYDHFNMDSPKNYCLDPIDDVLDTAREMVSDTASQYKNKCMDAYTRLPRLFMEKKILADSPMR